MTAIASPIPLRPYQITSIDRLRATVAAGKRRILYVLPTGGGKTTVAAEVVSQAIARGGRVLVLAHRTELIHQMAGRLRAWGLPVGIIKAGEAPDSAAPVQVASVASLANRQVPEVSLIVVDESHRATAESYRRPIEANPGAVVIGLTATPARTDGRGLGDVFDAKVEGATIAELIADGILMKPRVFAPPPPDLRTVKITAGDYNKLKLAEVMNKPELTGDILGTWRQHGGDRRTVVFASSIAHSIALRDAFRAAGVSAEHLDGETPAIERADILARLAEGSLRVVTNYGVLGEGWDCPPLGVCVLARPTKSLALYLQMVGRVLRQAPGKAAPLVLDHAGCVFEHGGPLEPREWTLAYTKRRNKAIAAAVAPITCLACYALIPHDSTACPECAKEVERYQLARRFEEPKSRKGELAELTDEQMAARKAEKFAEHEWRQRHREACRGFSLRGDANRPRAVLLAELRAFGTERAYKAGWPDWAYRRLTGGYPSAKVIALMEGEK